MIIDKLYRGKIILNCFLVYSNIIEHLIRIRVASILPALTRAHRNRTEIYGMMIMMYFIAGLNCSDDS